MDYRGAQKPRTIRGLQSYTQGDVDTDFRKLAVEIIDKAFKDETLERRVQILDEVMNDFREKLKKGHVKFPGTTFRLAIIAASNGRCQRCGKARYQMFTSDAGELLCLGCIEEVEDEVNLGIKIRPPKEPEGGTDWMKEEVHSKPGDLTDAEKKMVSEAKGITAIKMYRDRTGLGLLESKQVVEKWAIENFGGWTYQDSSGAIRVNRT
jgi:hypothetical protein